MAIRPYVAGGVGAEALANFSEQFASDLTKRVARLVG